MNWPIAALGRQVLDRLLTQRSHLRLGNAVFVHGGLDGRTRQATFLAPPWTAGTEARWAWITTGFLDWQGGFGGTLVVHGHTPPQKHSAAHAAWKTRTSSCTTVSDSTAAAPSPASSPARRSATVATGS